MQGAVTKDRYSETRLASDSNAEVVLPAGSSVLGAGWSCVDGADYLTGLCEHLEQ